MSTFFVPATVGARYTVVTKQSKYSYRHDIVTLRKKTGTNGIVSKKPVKQKS